MSLRIKFLTGTFGIIIFLGILVVVFVQTVLVQKLQHNLLQAGIAISTDILNESAEYLPDGNLIELHREIIVHKAALEDINYIFILDLQGNVLAHSFRETVPDELKKANIPEPGATQNIKSIVFEEEKVFDIASVREGVPGILHVGITENNIRKTISNIVLLIIGIFAGVLVLGGGMAVVFAAKISKPLFLLTKTAEMVGRGDLGHKVPVSTNDEIGKLSETFNKMTGDLKSTKEELIKLNTALETSNIELNITKERLLLERNRAQDFLDIVGVMIVVIDSDQHVSLINKHGAKLLGDEADEIIGQNWFENFIPERIRNEVKTVFEKLMTGKSESLEYYENPVLTRSGEERLIAWHNAILKDDSGNILGALSSGEDITEHRKIEDIIAKAKKEWEMTFDNADELIILVDKDFTIIRCNKGFAGFIGKPVKTIPGNKYTVIFPAGAGLVELCRQHTQTAPISKLEIKTEAGQWLYASCHPVFDEKNEFQHAIIMLTDITELKKAHQVLTSSQKELEKKVNELEQFYEVAVDREMKMKELKQEIAKLRINHDKDSKS